MTQPEPRRWLVSRAEWIERHTAVGMPLRPLEDAPRYDGRGRLDRLGAWAVVHSDLDPSRYVWGLLGCAPVSKAWELDARGVPIEGRQVDLWAQTRPQTRGLFDGE